MSVMAAAATTQNLKGPPQSSDYHVQQCLMQGPPPHSQQHLLHTSHPPFRIVHQRDGYPNQTQQTSQTPPQSDMKISGGQQQMVHSFVQQGRNANQNMYRPNQNQPPRNISRQQMVTAQPFMPMPQLHPLQYPPAQYSLPQRQAQPQMYSPNHQFNMMAAPYNFFPVQAITRPMSAPNLSSNTQPQGIGLPPTVLSSTTQGSNLPRKRRPNALKVEDPASGKDVLEEVYGEDSSQSIMSTVPHTDISEIDQQQQHDLNMLPETNVFINIEQQLPPPIVQQQTAPPPALSRAIPIQDALSETPVVSAQQDGPSIEIIPKQIQPSRKARKSICDQPAPPSYTHVSKRPNKDGIDKCITASIAIYDKTMAAISDKTLPDTERILHTSPHILKQIRAEKEQAENDSNQVAIVRPIVTPSPPLISPSPPPPSVLAPSPPPVTPSPPLITSFPPLVTPSPQVERRKATASAVQQPVTAASVKQKPSVRNRSVTASIAVYKATVETPNPKELILYPSPAVLEAIEKEKLAKAAEISTATPTTPVTTIAPVIKSEQPAVELSERVKPDSVHIREDAAASIILTIDNKDNKSIEEAKTDLINNNLTVTAERSEETIPAELPVIENTQSNMTTVETSVIEQMNNINNNLEKIPDILNNNISVDNDVKIVPVNDTAETVPEFPQPLAQVTPSTESVTMSMDSGVGDSTVPSTTSIIDDKSATAKKELIEYEEGQWSPNNQDGKKVYTIDQLRKLKDSTICLRKPDVKEHEVVLRDLRSAHNRADASGFQYNKYMVSSGGANNGTSDNIFLPNFARTNSNRGGGGRDYGSGKRVSQTGNKQQGGGKSGSKSGMIHVSLSLREEVKLNETENAWKPSVLSDSGRQISQEERSEQELFKRVRGILNKLTPEKFAALILQMKHLTIDTQTKLGGVIELIFEKAVDEPNFSIAYAQMCSNLSTISISSGNQNQIFQKLLLHHCQNQFEDIGSDKHTEFRKKLEECRDPEKRLEYEEEERKIRRRSVGTTRFVGELFKFDMLTVNIMIKCLTQMLDKKNEESLECLCKLLTTIGKNLTNLVDEKTNEKHLVQKIFDEMESLTTNKHFKISSRVRFMLQDVIDLKRSNWIPRRQDQNPKKMGEILKEAENEQLNIQLMNYPTGGRKDDVRRPGGGLGAGGPAIGGGASSSMGGGGYNVAGRSVSEDGWSTQISKNSRSSISNIDPKKLQTSKLNITNNMALGSASYYKWNTRQQQTPIETPTTNKFSALLDSQKSKRPFTSGGGSSSSSRNKDSYHSRDSMERYDRPQSSRIESMTYTRNSQSRDTYNDSPIMRAPPSNKLSSSGMTTGVSSLQSHESASVRAPSPLESGATGFTPSSMRNQQTDGDHDPNNLPEPTDEILKLMTDSFEIFDEYCNNLTKIDDCTKEIDRIPKLYRWSIVRETYCHVIECKRKHRIKISEIFVHAIKKTQLINLNQFTFGLRKYLDLMEDYSIDYPKIWEYIAEILGPLLRHRIINLKDLVMVADAPIAANLGGPMVISLFEELLGEYGPKFIRNLWKNSEVQWSDFIKSDVTEFVTSNKLHYITQTNTMPPSPKRKLDMSDFQDKLLSLLNIQTPYDEIIEWISVNVENFNNAFIRTLTTAVLKFSLEETTATGGTSYKLNVSTFEGQIQLLRRYIENNENNELQCLYAIQSLINAYEHPAGVLRTIVDKLYEEDIISIEGFTNWKHSTDPNEQEGKGVAQSSLVSFFTSLNEQVSSDDNIDESDNKDSKN